MKTTNGINQSSIDTPSIGRFRKGGEDPDMAELAMTALVLALIIKILDRV